MKNIFICFVFIGLNSYAQSDTARHDTWRFGINANSSLPTYVEPSMTTSAFARIGQHYISIGTKFYFPNDDRYNLYGFSANYRFIPNGVFKTLNFYFTALFDLDHEHFQKKSYYLNNNGYYYKDLDKLHLAFHLGYGLDVRFLQIIHFHQFIGIGLYTYKEQKVEEYNENGVTKIYNTHRGLFGEKQISLVINAGFGFDIFKIHNRQK